MFHIIKLCLPRSTLQVTTHAAKPDALQAGGPTRGAVFPTIVAEHPSAVLVHFGGSRTSRTRDIDGNFSKSVLRWLSLYPAAVGRGSDRGVTCYYTISTDKAIPGTSSWFTNTSAREPSAEELVANLESLLNSVLSSGSCHSYQLRAWNLLWSFIGEFLNRQTPVCPFSFLIWTLGSSHIPQLPRMILPRFAWPHSLSISNWKIVDRVGPSEIARRCTLWFKPTLRPLKAFFSPRCF